MLHLFGENSPELSGGLPAGIALVVNSNIGGTDRMTLGFALIGPALLGWIGPWRRLPCRPGFSPSARPICCLA